MTKKLKKIIMMMKNKKAGIIYTAECEVTGEFYVGATTGSVEQRKLDHIETSKRGANNKFHEAISTYGAEAFIWSQTDTANSIDELAQKEKTHIVNYNSKQQGYNSDAGGGFKKTIYQYNLTDGSLINSFDCLESAGNVVSATKQQLSRACLNVNNLFRGFYWSYEYSEPFQPQRDKRIKIIIQLDLENNVLNEFKSISVASKVTGVNKTSIAKVCRGERNFAGCFRWRKLF